MTLETIIRFADPTNHRLSDDQYQLLMEMGADCTRHGDTFDADIIREMCEEALVSLVDEVGMDAIRDEMFIRAVLDGQAESEFWTGC